MRHYCTRISIDGLDSLLFTATHKGQVIYTAKLYLNNRQDSDNAAVMESVWVHPEYRGQGYARKLLARVKKQARMHDKPYIVLQLCEQNLSARRLYEKAGYREYDGPDKDGLISAVLHL